MASGSAGPPTGKVDPIDLLRDAVSNGEPVTHHNGMILIGHQAKRVQIPDSFVCGVKFNTGNFDMGSIWFLLDRNLYNTGKPYNMKACEDAKYKFASAPERKDLIEYLNGTAGQAKCISGERKFIDLGGEKLNMTLPRGRARQYTDDANFERSVSRSRSPLRPMAAEPDAFSALRECLSKVEKKLRTNINALAVSNLDPRIGIEAMSIAKAELTGDVQPGARPMRHIDSEEHKKTMGLLWEIRGMGMRPTIVVPCTSSGLINILNIRTLLEEGRWTNPDQNNWRSRKKEIRMKHTLQDDEYEFRIVDSTAKFTKLDWKATVAVFVDGKEWQLKGWPFKSHGQLFNAIRGFHIYMDNLKPHPNCEQWSVEKMVLKRNTRHEDPALALKFWQTLEQFLLQKRSRAFTTEHVIGERGR